MQAVFPHMKAQGWGRIVNVGSSNGIRGAAGYGPYNASKEAIRALLAAGPHTRKQLKKLAKASASQITKKLNELRDEVGIIQFRRDGEDWFQLPSPGITKLGPVT